MKRLLLVLSFVFFTTTGMSCNMGGDTPSADTPEKQLAVAETTFQEIQQTIQDMIVAGVVTPEVAQCVKDANEATKAGLDQARRVVALNLDAQVAVISAFRQALLEISGIMTQIEAGTYQCRT